MHIIKKIIALNLCLIFLFAAAIKVQAGLSDQTQLSLAVNSGTLDVTASSTATFSPVSFSFNGQTSANNQLGSVNVSDTRGTFVGFDVDVTGEDWATGTPSAMDYDGDGVTTGQLSLDIPEIGEVSANASGQDTDGFTMGNDESFGAATSTISFVSVSSGNGSGDYWFSDFKASQFIPGNQPADTYTMNLTLTAS